MLLLTSYVFLLHSCLALNVVQTTYWNFAEPQKAKEVCVGESNRFNFTFSGPTGFITDTSYDEVCDGMNCTFSGTDSCDYWRVENGKIVYMNFTRIGQDPDDLDLWKKRPFCNAAPTETRTLEDGACIMENPDFGCMKVSIADESKSCTLTEETYKNEDCTQPSTAFPVHSEFDLNTCQVFGFIPGIGADEGGSLFAMKVVKVNTDHYQVQLYDDPNCIFPTVDDDEPGPQDMLVGQCDSDQDDDEATPFKTWTKLVSVTCKENHKNKLSAQRKSSGTTSFSQCRKRAFRKAMKNRKI